jgi:hypothetical protein
VCFVLLSEVVSGPASDFAQAHNRPDLSGECSCIVRYVKIVGILDVLTHLFEAMNNVSSDFDSV